MSFSKDQIPSEDELEQYFANIAHARGVPPLYQEFRSEKTQSDGIEIHMDIYEVGKEAPTVIFIPGTAVYAMCFVEVLHKIGQAGYNVIGFDPRGHGRSGGIRGDYTITELIRDTQEVIDYAKNRFGGNISLFGSSQGGIVAFYTAALEEERIQSAICQNIADLTRTDTIKLVRFPGLTKAIKPVLMTFSRLFPNADVPILSYLDLEKEKLRYFGDFKKFMKQDPLTNHTVKLKVLKSLMDTELPKPIEEIRAPLMVLQGNKDLIFPVSYTKKLYERLTCPKRLEIFKGLTHSMLVENVDTVAPPILEWLNSVHAPRNERASQDGIGG